MCRLYPAMSPFDVRRERFHDVVSVYCRTKRFEYLHENSAASAPGAETMAIGGEVYVEAQNDDWY